VSRVIVHLDTEWVGLERLFCSQHLLAAAAVAAECDQGDLCDYRYLCDDRRQLYCDFHVDAGHRGICRGQRSDQIKSNQIYFSVAENNNTQYKSVHLSVDTETNK